MNEVNWQPASPIKSLRYLEHLLQRDRRHLQALGDHAGRYYRSFDVQRIDKPNKWRHIDNPIGELKDVQKNIKKNILRHICLPPTMLGGVPGGSARRNAGYHRAASVVVTLDLRDCFPSIRHATVYDLLVEHLGCSAEIADLLTKLTTFQGHLPQGASTSSMLANLAVRPLHLDILKVATELDCACTMFVDDIAISGREARQAIGPVVKLIQSYAYAVACKKKRVMSSATKQMVTGIVVNKDLSIDRQNRESLRRDIIELASCADITLRQVRSVEGRIRHIAQFQPRVAESLTALADRILPVPTIEDGCTERYRHRPCRSVFARSHRAY